MSRPSFSAIREAVATRLATISGLRASTNISAPINPPMALVTPGVGRFANFGESLSGSVRYTLRAAVFVSEANAKGGQDLVDVYLAPAGSSSIWATFASNPTLSGLVEWAEVIAASEYGFVEANGVNYLVVHFDIEVGV